MAPRRVPVDWDDLEMALTMHSDEWASYLDLQTGKIRSSQTHPFGGERKEGELSEEEIEAGLADGTLIAVEPLPSSVEYEWMAEFADLVADVRLRRSLQAALAGRRPFRRFKDTLADHPRERERWFAFQAERFSVGPFQFRRRTMFPEEEGTESPRSLGAPPRSAWPVAPCSPTHFFLPCPPLDQAGPEERVEAGVSRPRPPRPLR